MTTETAVIRERGTGTVLDTVVVLTGPKGTREERAAVRASRTALTETAIFFRELGHDCYVDAP